MLPVMKVRLHTPEAAKYHASITERQLHYWDQCGLLRPVHRIVNDNPSPLYRHRRYTVREIALLKLIGAMRGTKETGWKHSIQEIRKIMELVHEALRTGIDLKNSTVCLLAGSGVLVCEGRWSLAWTKPIKAVTRVKTAARQVEAYDMREMWPKLAEA